MEHYKERDFALPDLKGLSKEQIDVHLKLYSGYVKNINALYDKINEYKEDSERHALALSELTRRIPFEWNGMRMHEYYFEALGGPGEPEGDIIKELEKQFGSFDTWLAHFKAVGAMRGTGWAALTRDKQTGTLLNIWVDDHEIGHLAGSDILIAMDVWEHAFLIDYLPSERKEYIDVFMDNLKWDVVNNRFTALS